MTDIPGRAALTERLQLGPGPSNSDPRVLEALGSPPPGHLDPGFLDTLDETATMLRAVFKTTNPLTFAISATGSAGMEASFVNLVEPGDEVVICVNGVFGGRMAEIARRCGARVTTVEFDWGKPVDAARIAGTLDELSNVRLVAAVHAETSTGTRSNIDEVCAVVRAASPDTLVVVDAVTSLAGIDVDVDGWGIDVCYAGTQKCLSVPAGLAPVTFGPRALLRIKERQQPPQSWYLDIDLIAAYLDAESRAYHHTAPSAMLVALHEGLRIVLEEGLDARFERHETAGAMLRDALTERGFELFAADGFRLPQLTAARVPNGIDEARVRRQLLNGHNIEIGAGLGAYKGELWRIGLMGHNARPAVVDRLITALDTEL